MKYTFNDHLHNYAVWTAARAVQRSFVKTAIIKEAIENSGLPAVISRNDITTSDEFDNFHDRCCREILNFFIKHSIKGASYGRAAKIVSIYIKTSIVIRDSGKSRLAIIAHPPIDNILLKNLDKKMKKGFSKLRWTQLDRQAYLGLIEELRVITPGEFWKLEQYWIPDQS